MRHAEDDLLHAELAAALDDLLQRRDQRLAAIEAEALGARVLDVEELLEAFRLDQLLRIAFLPSPVKAMSLSGPSMRSWIQAFSSGIGDVHELDAERRAIGALQDLEHLADGRVLEAEHVVDEDRAVIVGLGEAVGGRATVRCSLRSIAGRCRAGRDWQQVAAHAVGADHHDRADRIAASPGDGLGRSSGAVGRRLALDLLGDVAFRPCAQLPSSAATRSPLACDSASLALPGRARAWRCVSGGRVVLELGEEGAPVPSRPKRVLLVARPAAARYRRVAAVEERRVSRIRRFAACAAVDRASVALEPVPPDCCGTQSGLGYAARRYGLAALHCRSGMRLQL